MNTLREVLLSLKKADEHEERFWRAVLRAQAEKIDREMMRELAE
jgi:hypothetical protein